MLGCEPRIDGGTGRMTVEQGWSASIDRKIKRALARRLVSRPFDLPHEPTMTITFDDVPDSAVRAGAPVLETHGVRGTFYVAGATVRHVDRHWTCAAPEDLRALRAAGHEIACHTADHVNVQSLSRGGLADQWERNAALIADMTGAPVSEHFAYPFGDLGISQKRVLERHFLTCRSIYERLNTGRVDLGCLGAIGLFDSAFDERSLATLLETAVRSGAWLIFYTHDVSDEPSFMGSSPSLLATTLRLAASMGLRCSTIAAAASAYGLARPNPAPPA